VVESPKGHTRPSVSISPTSLPLVGCGSARQVGTWIQTQNNGQVASAVWRICAEQWGSGEVWKLVPRLGLVVVLAASTATSQTERLPLAAIRRRAAELNNGAFRLVFSFWTTVSKDEKTAGVCRGSLGREALRRVKVLDRHCAVVSKTWIGYLRERHVFGPKTVSVHHHSPAQVSLWSSIRSCLVPPLSSRLLSP
jgi:hypothetical protein